MSNKLIHITLTRGEYELLDEAVSAYTDEGPSDEGWSSPKLRALKDKIEAIGQELSTSHKSDSVE